MAHRIRKAMEKDPSHDSPKLDGIVEADETFVGGRKRVGSSGPTARGTKTIVFTLIQRDGEARSQVINDLKGSTLQGIIRRNVTGTAHIMTDENPAYHGLAKQFASHESVSHAQDEWVRGIIHVNFSESYFSLFKRGIIGAFHHISKRHTPRYLEEVRFPVEQPEGDGRRAGPVDRPGRGRQAPLLPDAEVGNGGGV